MPEGGLSDAKEIDLGAWKTYSNFSEVTFCNLAAANHSFLQFLSSHSLFLHFLFSFCSVRLLVMEDLEFVLYGV